jgi:DNA-binding Xre family transcriptional regulator
VSLYYLLLVVLSITGIIPIIGSMRLRLPELLANREMTRYAFAKAVEGRISTSTAYRLAAGNWKSLSSDVMETLCEVLDVEPGELFEREGTRRRRKKAL